MLRALIGFLLFLLLSPALLFIAAGTLDWPMAWVYILFLLVASLISRLIAWIKHPDMLRERARFASAEGVQPWDRVLVLVVGMLGPLLMAVVAGLDHRFAWSPQLPAILPILAVLIVALGFSMSVWAMLVNRYFSAVARIQRDRGQQVVTGGPYRIVRHPGYAGALLAYLALPFMLSTLWVLLPALGMVAALAMRTKLEDNMLMAELDGYSEYAARTPYRLLPGIW